MTIKPTSRASTAGERSAANSGFCAQLKNATLFDLIQFECLSRVSRSFRVSSEGRTALLYFHDGRIVHAAAGRATGEAAVREVLTWGRGDFQADDGPWPLHETITAGWESVLLRATQAIDERNRSATNVVALPVREVEAGSDGIAGGMVKARRVPSGFNAQEVELALRLSKDGELLDRGGPPDDGFSDAVAYATQLTDLVGELLGVDGFISLELTFHQGKCLVYRQADGDTVALRPGPRGSIEVLRQKLGLGSG